MVADGDHPDLAALLDGSSRVRRDVLDSHLLVCDACWEAVRDDRAGRLLAEDLRECAPATLRDRIGLAGGALVAPPSSTCPTEDTARRARHQPRRRSLQAVALVAAGTLFALATLTGRPSSNHIPGGKDPTIVSVVVSLAGSHAGSAVAGDLRQLGQQATVSAVTSAGSLVVVARSQTPFAMPDHAVPMTSTNTPWLAVRGRITLVCFNLPHPILLASVLPADQLVALAKTLDPGGP